MGKERKGNKAMKGIGFDVLVNTLLDSNGYD
jgi:hypothetical protein